MGCEVPVLRRRVMTACKLSRCGLPLKERGTGCPKPQFSAPHFPWTNPPSLTPFMEGKQEVQQACPRLCPRDRCQYPFSDSRIGTGVDGPPQPIPQVPQPFAVMLHSPGWLPIRSTRRHGDVGAPISRPRTGTTVASGVNRARKATGVLGKRVEMRAVVTGRK